MLIKEIKSLCNLYELEFDEVYAHRDDYLITLKNVLELDILKDVLNDLVYINKGSYGSEIRTKEGYTMVESKTIEEYNNIKKFDLNKLYKDLSTLTLEDHSSQQTIINMIIPKIFVIHADRYNEKRYDNMLGRLYA